MMPATDADVDRTIADAEAAAAAAAAAVFRGADDRFSAAAAVKVRTIAAEAADAVRGSVAGKNERAKADAGTSALFQARDAMDACLEGLPDGAKLGQDGFGDAPTVCEMDASVDWLDREEAAPALSAYRKARASEARAALRLFRDRAAALRGALDPTDSRARARDLFDARCDRYRNGAEPAAEGELSACANAALADLDQVHETATAAILAIFDGDRGAAAFALPGAAALVADLEVFVREWLAELSAANGRLVEACQRTALESLDRRIAALIEDPWAPALWSYALDDERDAPRLEAADCRGAPSSAILERAEDRLSDLALARAEARARVEAYALKFFCGSAGLAAVAAFLFLCARLCGTYSFTLKAGCVLGLGASLYGQAKFFLLEENLVATWAASRNARLAHLCLIAAGLAAALSTSAPDPFKKRPGSKKGGPCGGMLPLRRSENEHIL
jgi:hypothetical protein